MSECSHPSTFHSMCVVCGKVVESVKNASSITISGGAVLQLSTTEAERVQAAKVENLKKMKKLALVLDLDHTLLHAVQIEGPTPANSHNPSQPDIYHLPIEELVNGTVKHLVMKKRPNLDSFLAQAHEFCQMTVYTAGTRRYAEAVVKLLDPQNKYINNRIVARTDDKVVNISKSLQKIFLNDSSMAVILDDREDVWKGSQSEQLLLVRPYLYFHPSAVTPSLNEVNNLPGLTASLPANLLSPCPVVSLFDPPGKLLKMAPQNTAEFTEADDQLPRCLQILREVHKQYFSSPSPSSTSLSLSYSSSVVVILNSMRRKILAGCVLTFSGIIPVNDPHPQQHFLYKLSLSMGAKVSLSLSPSTTHLLCLNTQTKKAQSLLTNRSNNTANSSGNSRDGTIDSNGSSSSASKSNARNKVYIVHPDWLIYCKWSLCRVKEETFLLTVDNWVGDTGTFIGSVAEARDLSSGVGGSSGSGVIATSLTLSPQPPGSSSSSASLSPSFSPPSSLTPQTKKRRLEEVVTLLQQRKKGRGGKGEGGDVSRVERDEGEVGDKEEEVKTEAQEIISEGGLLSHSSSMVIEDMDVKEESAEEMGGVHDLEGEGGIGDPDAEVSTGEELEKTVIYIDLCSEEEGEEGEGGVSLERNLYEEDAEGDEEYRAYTRGIVSRYSEEDDYTMKYNEDEADEEEGDYADTGRVSEGSYEIDMEAEKDGWRGEESSEEEDFEGFEQVNIMRTDCSPRSPLSHKISDVSMAKSDSNLNLSVRSINMNLNVNVNTHSNSSSPSSSPLRDGSKD